MKFFMILIVILFTFLVYADNNEIKVKCAVGLAYITGNKTPDQAWGEALNNAKLDALNKADIPITVSSNVYMADTEIDDKYSEIFSSTITTETKGNVINYEIVNEKRDLDDSGVFYVKIEINATVLKYESKPDLSFIAEIKGIDVVYEHDEPIEFTLEPMQDMYLKIFYISDEGSWLMFPIKGWHDDILFNKNEIYEAPFSNKIDNYTATALKPIEIGRLIIVITKNNIPYIDLKSDPDGYLTQTEAEDILSWIYKIEPGDRDVSYFPLTIKK